MEGVKNGELPFFKAIPLEISLLFFGEKQRRKYVAIDHLHPIKFAIFHSYYPGMSNLPSSR